MAAVAVLFHHLHASRIEGELGIQIANMLTKMPPLLFGYSSSIFFVLAGYFACRNITWKKAWHNTWWCFAPMLLWSLLFFLEICSFSEPPASLWPVYWPDNFNWASLFGIQSFLFKSWVIFPESAELPVNIPLWFMRDLIFLFLFSPLLSKISKFLFPALVLLSLLPCCHNMFSHGYTSVAMSPYSLGFFTCGCFLRSFSKENQRAMLSFYSIPMIVGVLAFQCVYIKYLHIYLHIPPFVHALVSLWVFYQIARLIEVKLPFITPLALKYAPITFLTFAGHLLVYTALPTSNITLLCLQPLLVFLLMGALFFTLKKWCRPLLMLVAHYKLRPDDLEPPTGARGSETSTPAM